MQAMVLSGNDCHVELKIIPVNTNIYPTIPWIRPNCPRTVDFYHENFNPHKNVLLSEMEIDFEYCKGLHSCSEWTWLQNWDYCGWCIIINSDNIVPLLLPVCVIMDDAGCIGFMVMWTSPEMSQCKHNMWWDDNIPDLIEPQMNCHANWL